MPDQVERFAFVRGDAVLDETGGWVRYLDYEKARKQRDEELRERLEAIPKEDGIADAFILRSTVLAIFEETDHA